MAVSLLGVCLGIMGLLSNKTRQAQYDLDYKLIEWGWRSAKNGQTLEAVSNTFYQIVNERTR